MPHPYAIFLKAMWENPAPRPTDDAEPTATPARRRLSRPRAHGLLPSNIRRAAWLVIQRR